MFKEKSPKNAQMCGMEIWEGEGWYFQPRSTFRICFTSKFESSVYLCVRLNVWLCVWDKPSENRDWFFETIVSVFRRFIPDNPNNSELYVRKCKLAAIFSFEQLHEVQVVKIIKRPFITHFLSTGNRYCALRWSLWSELYVFPPPLVLLIGARHYWSCLAIASGSVNCDVSSAAD